MIKYTLLLRALDWGPGLGKNNSREDTLATQYNRYRNHACFRNYLPLKVTAAGNKIPFNLRASEILLPLKVRASETTFHSK